MSDDTKIEALLDSAVDGVEQPQESSDIASLLDKEPAQDGESAQEISTEALPEDWALALPEGVVMPDELTGSFAKAIKDAGLTKAQADKFTEQLKNIHSTYVEINKKNWEETTKQWDAEVKANPLFATSEKAKSEASISMAANYFLKDSNLPESFRSGLNQLLRPASEANPNGAGLIKNPVIAELFVHVGKLLKSDSAVAGTMKPQKRTTPSQLFYGD